jgi:hypothetical protein
MDMSNAAPINRPCHLRRVIRQVLASVDDLGHRVLGKERLDTDGKLRHRQDARPEIAERQPQRQLVDVVAGQPRAKENEGNQEYISAQSHDLNQRVLLHREEQQHRPRHQDEDPVAQIPRSLSLPCGLRPPQLRGVQPQHGGIEEQMREAVRQVGANDAVGVADAKHGTEPGDERTPGCLVAEREARHAERDRNHPRYT